MNVKNPFPYDKYLTGVLVLSTAADRVGLCYFNSWFLQLATNRCELNNIELPMCRYYYVQDLDREHYLKSSESNPNLLIPTQERALVDYIKLEEEYGDEGILIESLQSYLAQHSDNLEKLYEVADFFKLPREELEYWLKEAREESYMSEG
jgi:hypothetical protein